MAAFFKKIAGAVVRALARLVGIGALLDTTALWAIVFKLTKAGADGANLLQIIYLKYGLNEARNAAQSIITATKSAQPAALMASLEFREGNIEDAQQWVKLTSEKNTEDIESLLIIKLYLSEFFAEYDKKSIIEQILAINYLPMEVTRIALVGKAFAALEDKDLQLAEQTAERILSVEEQAAALIVKAALAIEKKNLQEAEKLLIKAQRKLTPGLFYPLAAGALLCVGHNEMAMEYLCRAGKLDDRLIRSKTQLGDLARSQEFNDYCSRRNKPST